MKKYVIRLGIITCWVGLLFGALYWPKLKVLHYDANTINVFAWGDILDPAIVAQFEKEKNIKVHLNYYASNEELIVKLKATKGEGYDLIIPSDYAVHILAQEGLLQTLDKQKLTFWNEINPNLLGHRYDPQNEFSIPFEWEVFVFGIDKDYFAMHPNLPKSWKLLFDKETIQYKISMTNDPIEATLFAAYYLFGNTEDVNQAEAKQIENLLITQKQWVEAYANFRGDYFLATRNCPVAAASSSYIRRTMRLFPFVSFIVPEEGTFITIETLAIPKVSKKEDLTYQFINYLYSHESVRSHFNTYGFFPATLQAIQDVELEPEAKELVFASSERFKRFHFIKEIMPQEKIRDIWVEVKAGKYE